MFHLKVCVWRGEGRRNGGIFEGGAGEGPHNELVYPIRLHTISGRSGGGGGCRIFNYHPSPPPTTLLNGTALTL